MNAKLAVLVVVITGLLGGWIALTSRANIPYVFLYHPTTHERAFCGQRSERGATGAMIQLRDQCVAKYKAAGYRVAKAGDGLPDGFIHLDDVAPDVVQDMRYATAHNFTGAAVPGYEASTCIMTLQAADALAQVQAAVRAQGFTLIVWDCYRPATAVRAFVDWAKGPDERAKAEFYPRVPKSELFARGYIASRSRHSSGSTVDLGLAKLGLTAAPRFDAGAPQVDCAAPYGARFADGAVDLGTGYDCFDAMAHADSKVGQPATANRATLQAAMTAAGFAPYSEEWWHFTLKGEPFEGQAFDFPVR